MTFKSVSRSRRRQSLVLAKACIFLAVTLFASQFLTAQDANNERLFGNGRFLKRVFGGSSKSDKSEAKAKQLKANSKQPSLAKRPGPSKQSTLAKRPVATKQPTVAKRPAASQPTRSMYNNRPSQSAQPTLATRSVQPAPAQRISANPNFGSRLPKGETADRGTDQPIDLPTRSSAQATSGFGMLVELRKEKLYVTRMDPHGNAAKAGLHIGDHLVSAGGIDFESLADFNGIGEILSSGDQLEFEYRRDGQTTKRLIAYGKAPEESEEVVVAPVESSKIEVRQPALKPAINRINTKPNDSFLPNANNVQPRPNQNFLPRKQQSTGLTPAQQTIRAQQLELERLKQQVNQLEKQPTGSNRGLQIPPGAKSVLD